MPRFLPPSIKQNKKIISPPKPSWRSSSPCTCFPFVCMSVSEWKRCLRVNPVPSSLIFFFHFFYTHNWWLVRVDGYKERRVKEVVCGSLPFTHCCIKFVFCRQSMHSVQRTAAQIETETNLTSCTIISQTCNLQGTDMVVLLLFSLLP